jgi:hypothetical protein
MFFFPVVDADARPSALFAAALLSLVLANAGPPTIDASRADFALRDALVAVRNSVGNLIWIGQSKLAMHVSNERIRLSVVLGQRLLLV